jgi:hypothetical protein
VPALTEVALIVVEFVHFRISMFLSEELMPHQIDQNFVPSYKESPSPAVLFEAGTAQTDPAKSIVYGVAMIGKTAAPRAVALVGIEIIVRSIRSNTVTLFISDVNTPASGLESGPRLIADRPCNEVKHPVAGL